MQLALFTEGGHYSLVNNVRGDSIHGGTVFTPTPAQKNNLKLPSAYDFHVHQTGVGPLLDL